HIVNSVWDLEQKNAQIGDIAFIKGEGVRRYTSTDSIDNNGDPVEIKMWSNIVDALEEFTPIVGMMHGAGIQGHFRSSTVDQNGQIMVSFLTNGGVQSMEVNLTNNGEEVIHKIAEMNKNRIAF